MEVRAPGHVSTAGERDQAGDADQRWDELLARPKAKDVMRQMAQEARYRLSEKDFAS